MPDLCFDFEHFVELCARVKLIEKHRVLAIMKHSMPRDEEDHEVVDLDRPIFTLSEAKHDLSEYFQCFILSWII